MLGELEEELREVFWGRQGRLPGGSGWTSYLKIIKVEQSKEEKGGKKRLAHRGSWA